MKFGRPSRKDDLISLAYLILMLSNDLWFFKYDISHLTQIEYFYYVRSLKEELTIDDYCCSPESKLLKPYITEVWGLNYEEKPDYGTLKFMLVNILLNNDVLPNINLLKEEDPKFFSAE